MWTKDAYVKEEHWMVVLESEELYDEEHLTLKTHAWRAHHLRSFVLTCVHVGERALHLKTLS
jgi:hypothetical protein